MMLHVSSSHMGAFMAFASRAGLRYAQCNQGWVMTYDEHSHSVAVAWLCGRGLERQIVQC